MLKSVYCCCSPGVRFFIESMHVIVISVMRNRIWSGLWSEKILVVGCSRWTCLNLVPYFDWTPIFEWCVVRCGPKNGHWKTCSRDWTSCSKFVNHSRLNMQHNWGDLSDHSMRKRIFTLIMIKIFIWALKCMKKSLQAWFGFANHLALILWFNPTRSRCRSKIVHS